MSGVFKRFLLTLSYVTSLPLKSLAAEIARSIDENAGDPDEPSHLHGLAKYLPCAGLVIGAVLLVAAVALLNQLGAPPVVCGPVLCITWLCLTGGLHFDGLMDAADGIFSHRNPERMLEIMQDSRVGNFGAMAGMSVFLVKATALIGLCSQPLLMFASLILIPIWSRWCELYAIGRFPYAREHGKGKIWHTSTRFPNDLFLGMIVPVVVSAIVAHCTDLNTIFRIVAFTLLVGILSSHWLASHIKGQTGDTYGAVVELSEAGCLLILAVSMSR